MASKFKPSYSGVGSMIRSPEMQAEMHGRAEKVADLAEATAPVGDPATDPHPGRYKESFDVESGSHGGWKHDRAYGRAKNTAPEAYYVEFGNKNVKRYRTLGNALGAAGD